MSSFIFIWNGREIIESRKNTSKLLTDNVPQKRNWQIIESNNINLKIYLQTALKTQLLWFLLNTFLILMSMLYYIQPVLKLINIVILNPFPWSTPYYTYLNCKHTEYWYLYLNHNPLPHEFLLAFTVASCAHRAIF